MLAVWCGVVWVVLWSGTHRAVADTPPASPSSSAVAGVVAVPEVDWQRPLLFRVTSTTEGAEPVYLFGTYHVGIDIDRDGPPSVAEHFEASSMYVMEVDIADAVSAAPRYSTVAAGEPSLRESLGPELWSMLLERMPEAEALEQHRAWVVTTMLSLQMLPEGQTPGMDLVLLTRARQEGRELGFLETADTQLAVLDQVMDVEVLGQMLQGWDEEVARAERLRAAFLAGDLGELQASLYDDLDDADRERLVALLDVRNEAWLPELEAIIERGDAFVAFGAGHLVGERGVLALLRERGHSVERIE